MNKDLLPPGYVPRPPHPNRKAEAKVKEDNIDDVDFTPQLIQQAGFVDPRDTESVPESGPKHHKTRRARAATKHQASTHSHQRMLTTKEVYGNYYHPALHDE